MQLSPPPLMPRLEASRSYCQRHDTRSGSFIDSALTPAYPPRALPFASSTSRALSSPWWLASWTHFGGLPISPCAALPWRACWRSRSVAFPCRHPATERPQRAVCGDALPSAATICWQHAWVLCVECSADAALSTSVGSVSSSRRGGDDAVFRPRVAFRVRRPDLC